MNLEEGDTASVEEAGGIHVRRGGADDEGEGMKKM